MRITASNAGDFKQSHGPYGLRSSWADPLGVFEWPLEPPRRRASTDGTVATESLSRVTEGEAFEKMSSFFHKKIFEWPRGGERPQMNYWEQPTSRQSEDEFDRDS